MLGDQQSSNGHAATDVAHGIVMNAAHALRVVAETVGTRRDRPSEVVCVEARSDELRVVHHRIRRAVFVEEQGIFAESDIDEHDAGDDVVRVVAFNCGQPVGAVRLYPIEEHNGLWKGDRLAVLADRRSSGAGAPLVRFAVAHATAHGGRRMIAHIQVANVRFFERLGWSAYADAEEYLGLMHRPMHIPLIDC
jgi:putative N-acetyltransferase (TIGR04045 family)